MAITSPTLHRPTQTGLRLRVLERWHLLSLDAPTVATLWTWFIARTAHLTLPVASLAAMFLAVWILYAADRLLDARALDHNPLTATGLEPRHHFHHRHRASFLTGIIAASLALTPLLLELPAQAMRLYLVEATLLIAWFLLIHIAQSAHRLPKELAVGPFFAAATFIPTVARSPHLRADLLIPAFLFAILCSLNCLFLYAWENPQPTRAHLTTRLSLRILPTLPIALTLAALIHATLAPPTCPIDLTCILSALTLLLLHHHRTHLHPTTLRATADLALLTPILLALK